MSAWYQWFSAAPTMIIERPLVFSALVANWRATWMILSRDTPVIFSAHAGVYGTSSSRDFAALASPRPASTP